MRGFTLLLIGVASWLVSPMVEAGTIPVGASDPAYRAFGQEFPSAAHLEGVTNGEVWNSSGTLVGIDWVLTAAHVTSNASDITITIAGGTYNILESVPHPEWNGDATSGNDLALVRLEQALPGASVAPLYPGTDELGQTAAYAGFGKSGTGLTGATTSAGTLRAGKNVIDSVGLTITDPGNFPGQPDITLSSFSDRLLFSDFDSGTASDNSLDYDYTNLSMSSTSDPLPLEYEYMIAPGDNGGGVFLDVAGQHYLAGVTSFIFSIDGDANSDYGDMSGAVRVSSHLEWIQSIVNPVPEPSTLLLALGGLLLLPLRRRR